MNRLLRVLPEMNGSVLPEMNGSYKNVRSRFTKGYYPLDESFYKGLLFSLHAITHFIN